MKSIALEVFAEELGSAFSQKAAAAWTSFLTFINRLLEENVSINPVTAADKNIMVDNVIMAKGNKQFGSNMLLK